MLKKYIRNKIKGQPRNKLKLRTRSHVIEFDCLAYPNPRRLAHHVWLYFLRSTLSYRCLWYEWVQGGYYYG